MLNYILEFGRCNFGLLLKCDFILVLTIPRVALAFDLLGNLKLFLLPLFFLEVMLQLIAVFIAPEMQIVNRHEYLPQVQILLAELFVAYLYLRLDLVFLLQSLFN